MGGVPDTSTFNLQDVVDVVPGIGSNDLVECFAHAIDGAFNSSYKESKNQLDDFRDYDGEYDSDWGGCISWGLVTYDASKLYFSASNFSTYRDSLTSNIDWRVKLASNIVDSGTSTSGSLNHGASSYPSASWTNPSFDKIEVKTTNGSWMQIYP